MTVARARRGRSTPPRGRGGKGRRPGRRLVGGALAVSVVLVALAALGVDLLEAGPVGSVAATAASPPESSSTSVAPEPSAPPSVAPEPSASARASASAQASVPEPSASASASPTVAGAPTSALGFRPTATVVDMGLPFRTGTSFRYGAGWRAPRDGVVYPYELVRGVAADGTLLRAHDGQDLRVPVGTLVVAPFGGTVVDPATLWRPWDTQRYGKVVVIRSGEPASAGYLVVLAHLSRVSVPVGSVVARGQVVGRSGRTGNAAGTPPHLHIEIRAPFLIRYGYGGVIRRLDQFDIAPSLRAAEGAAAKAG